MKDDLIHYAVSMFLAAYDGTNGLDAMKLALKPLMEYYESIKS